MTQPRRLLCLILGAISCGLAWLGSASVLCPRLILLTPLVAVAVAALGLALAPWGDEP